MVAYSRAEIIKASAYLIELDITQRGHSFMK